MTNLTESTCVKSASVGIEEEVGLTFGCELEWSDIDRSVDIPRELGFWEGPKIGKYYMGSEIDIVNTRGRWKGVAVDPLCIMCTAGGEIHTTPSFSIESQLIRIMRIMELFPKLGVACPNHGHIHVGVPELKTNLEILKNFFRYLKKNENDLIKACCGYDESDYKAIASSDLDDHIKGYFLVGDAKHINSELYDWIEKSQTMDEALEGLAKIECFDWCPLTEESWEAPGSHRTAVNMFNLTKGDTIEFRVFRASLNPLEIWSSLLFSKLVVEEAFKGEKGLPVSEILKNFHFSFPKLNFDPDLARGWQNTRQTKGRCGPFKKSFSSEDLICEDPVYISGPVDGFDEGLLNIQELCKCVVNGDNNW